jgi:DNA-binding transcriptional ArsR family regulator
VSAYGVTVDHVLDALGDPTRRRVLELLRPGPRAVGELAADLPVSRPAVSQHLRVLKGAGLVTERREGTRHLYRIDPVGLAALRTYLETFWDDALIAFRDTADRDATGPSAVTGPTINTDTDTEEEP